MELVTVEPGVGVQFPVFGDSAPDLVLDDEHTQLFKLFPPVSYTHLDVYKRQTLTIEDIDLYSKISRRAMKEYLYSIIDSCFMPCGIECDQYSVIGEIKEIQKIKNKYTNEAIYWLNLECSDLNFIICINGKDLLGEPAVGRRFKGQIWMQGILNFQELGRTGN